MEEISIYTRDISGSCLEIGCAPGRWMLWMNKINGLRVSGLDYSEEGLDITTNIFKDAGLETPKLYCGDLFGIDPDSQYDLVYSLGFIEHFSEPRLAVKKHLEWLKPGGTLIIGIPNFSGLYKLTQQFVNPEILKAHNLSIMNLDWFRMQSEELGLRMLRVGYIGSIDPALIVPARHGLTKRHLPIKLAISLIVRLRKLRVIDRVNSRWLSSYIFFVAKKEQS